MADTKTFLQAVKDRHTYYDLKAESPISDDRIVELTKTALSILPSTFNSQSTRIVVLLHDHHRKLWESTKAILLSFIPEAQHPATSAKMDGFRNAYGTILFFEDDRTVRELQSTFPPYAEKFPQFSEHTSAIHQFFLWTALEAEGFGANLQHYSPVHDLKIQEEWGVNKNYRNIAQLVFGTPNSGPQIRPEIVTFQPLEETLRVFK